METQTLINWLSDHFELATTAFFAIISAVAIYFRSRQTKNGKKTLAKSLAKNLGEPLTLHPEIDPVKCLGCGTCTAACPEGDILKLIDHKAVLVAPTKCVGHGECEKACPQSAITLVFGTKTRGMEIPRINSNYETNIQGLYITGELGGMGLIRNAIKQGVIATQHAFKQLKQSPLRSALSATSTIDLLIIGAGPAGLAASLKAKELGLNYLCIEQNSFGGTVFNFPRQKIVMTVPADLPLVGLMKFKANHVSKEELLEFWNGVRAKQALNIQEHTKFDSLQIHELGFQIGYTHTKNEVKAPQTIIARKVILAIGVRGSPRKLGLPNEDLAKVAYNLIDAEQYENKQIVVVGGGNAGVEAAIALAKDTLHNEVRLLVRGKAFDRCNETNQNLVQQLANAGRITICYESSVKEIFPETLTLDLTGEKKSIANDYLFVFAGAEMPQKFLATLGVAIDQKFGEALAA